MAKKKPIAKSDKARVELRLDQDVYAGIKQLAESADISVNQLMQGVARWASDNGHVGEPEMFDYDKLAVRDQPGCVWFGWREEEVDVDEDGQPNYVRRPQIVFALDFTERHVIRDEWRNETPVGDDDE